MKFLKLSGKIPSEKDRLPSLILPITMLVIGRISEGKQDLSRLVGIGSNRQDALEDLEIKGDHFEIKFRNKRRPYLRRYIEMLERVQKWATKLIEKL